MREEGGSEVNLSEYLASGHFIEAAFENFESKFLQIAFFIVLSAFLYQKGSSELKGPDKNEAADSEPNPNKEGAPWPVKKGGVGFCFINTR